MGNTTSSTIHPHRRTIKPGGEVPEGYFIDKGVIRPINECKAKSSSPVDDRPTRDSAKETTESAGVGVAGNSHPEMKEVQS